jgi:hypothetical protein
MEWIETNGVVLRYELSGAGRIPLLLIHELGGSLEFWVVFQIWICSFQTGRPNS